MYNKKMPMLQELKDMLCENNIRAGSHLNKPEIIKLLIENDLLSEKPPEPKKEIDPTFLRLSTIRRNPKSVVLRDIETEEEQTSSSLYKAA